MKKVLIFASLALTSVTCLLDAMADQHHIWNRTGETILVKFEYSETGSCSPTYAILHHTPALPYNHPQAIAPYPDWLQPIEKGVFKTYSCSIKKIVVTGLTGIIKGQQKDYVFQTPVMGPVHFVIDRNRHTISISTGDLRNIYKQDPAKIPELTLKRYDDATEKLVGQKYYYAWNTDELMRQNIKKELKDTEDLMNNTSVPMAQKAARIQTLLYDAKQRRDQLLQLYNQLPK
jgi:hypothetical protein